MKTKEFARAIGCERQKIYRNKPIYDSNNKLVGYYTKPYIRWGRMNSILEKNGYGRITEEQKQGYIPQEMAFAILLRKNNIEAKHFRSLLTNFVLPSYSINESNENEFMRKEFIDSNFPLNKLQYMTR